ncbi:MAG: hypothetical protein ACI9VR_001470 [Cognaticolwellia sp.]
MIWLLACLNTELDSGSGVDSAGLPSLERPDSERAWSAEQAEQAAQSIFDQGFPSPWVGVELYFFALQQGDASCPGLPEQIAPHNLQGCAADTGWYYSGMSRFKREIAPWEQDGTLILEAEQAFGDFSLLDPSGQHFECGGHQEAAVALAEGRVPTAFVGEHKGTYVWEGHEGVYREGVSGQLEVQIDGSGSQRRISLSGALEYLGQPFHSSLSLSEACGWAPESGTLQIRDPSSDWLTWTPSSCTGCGPLVDEEQNELGQVCLDLAPVAGSFQQQLDQLQ